MNWNGNRETLNFLIAKRNDPDNATALQAEFNAKRRARINAAITTRPVFLPLEFSLLASAQVSPYRDTTESLDHDVLIIGIKSDRPDRFREVIIRRTEDEKPVAYFGDEVNLNLRIDDIAGIAASNGGGQTGIFYWPQPIILPAGNRMTVEVFKTDADAAEEMNVVLIGVRTFNKAYGAVLLDKAERERIDMVLATREAPRTVYLKQNIEFSSAVAGGEARNIYTPQVPEPLLVRGIRTTLRQSQLELSINGEPRWMTRLTPIWAVAGEDEMIHDNYHWFAKPIYLHSNTSISIDRIVNSIDGTLIDPQGTTVGENTITWICDTV